MRRNVDPEQGCQIWHPIWVRLASNGTNLGLFKISFSTFWLGEPQCTETDLKQIRFVPFAANLAQLGANPGIPV